MNKRTYLWVHFLAAAVTGMGVTVSAQAMSVQELRSAETTQPSLSSVVAQEAEEKLTPLSSLVRENQERTEIAARGSENLKRADSHYSQGVMLQQQGKLEEAIAQYREAIRFNPKLAEAYLNLGAALASQGKSQEAIAAYQAAIRRNPNMPEAYYNIGNTLAQQGKLEEAVVQYRQAIRMNPNYAKAHYNLGNVLAQQERGEDAIAQWQEAIRIQPEFAEAYANLGVILSRQGQQKQATEAFRKARDLFKKQGNTDQAERIERILQRIEGNTPAIT